MSLDWELFLASTIEMWLFAVIPITECFTVFQICMIWIYPQFFTKEFFYALLFIWGFILTVPLILYVWLKIIQRRNC